MPASYDFVQLDVFKPGMGTTSGLRSSNRGFDLIFKRSCPLGASKLARRDKERTETQ